MLNRGLVMEYPGRGSDGEGGVEMLKALWLLGIWMCILTFPIGEL
nr:MAG TPA: hypothetical protein [Caudoviricetes sp.]